MNTHVKRLQNYLVWNNFYTGRVDGVFGPKTLEATMAAIEADPADLDKEDKPLVVDRIGDTQLIMDECKKQGLLRNQCAYVLATAYWETNKTMKPVVEAYWFSEDWRKRNLRYYPWHGRGYVQLTWEANYKRAGRELDIPLTEKPDLAKEPEHAVRILVTGMMEGWFTGKKLADYIDLKTSNYISARRIINGTDRAKAIAEIATDYEQDLEAEGYGVE